MCSNNYFIVIENNKFISGFEIAKLESKNNMYTTDYEKKTPCDPLMTKNDFRRLLLIQRHQP